MLVTNSIHFVESDYRSDFRTAIAGVGGTGSPQPASEYADIQIAQGGALNQGGPGHLIIKSVVVSSIENFNSKVEFYERSVPKATAAVEGTLNGLLGMVQMIDQNAAQPNTYFATAYQQGTLFIRVAEGLDIPYWDKEAKGQLHVKLSNISAVNKSAGDVGAVHIRVGTIIAS